MTTCCVFEYMYRDAGNWKTHGALLLSGAVVSIDVIGESLEPDGLFVAEQVGIPSLCADHFASCGDGPSGLDHAYHEFVDLRRASNLEVDSLPVFCSMDELLGKFRAAAGHWDVRLSPNCHC